MKYKKVHSNNKSILIKIIILVIITLCHVFLLFESLKTNDSNSNLNENIITIIISYIATIYCIVQEIYALTKQSDSRFEYQNKHEIPFIDRKELLTEIIDSSFKEINNNNFYFIKNIRYGEKNGKTSLSKRLCYELQKIKDKRDNILVDNKLLDKRIGNIIYLDYGKYGESFIEEVKLNHTYIKGKKNIVVIKNSCNNAFIWDTELEDRDIFFIFLNFNNNSNNQLFFSDDKIVQLIQELKKNPKYSYIYDMNKKGDINDIASKLGNISHNNIGTIIDVLMSNEFETLLSTDKQFIDFYFEIKNGNYKKAKELYEKIDNTQNKNTIFKYKKEFELANLNHFLGKYTESLGQLEILLSKLMIDQNILLTNVGKNMCDDIILLQAHINKHLGKFNEALDILNKNDSSEQTIPFQRAFFSISIFQLNSHFNHDNTWNNFLNDLKHKMWKFKNDRTIKNSDYYFYETYYPIVKFYTEKYNKKVVPKLINIENQAINFYQKEERRYLTNCYFIKAELYRIIKKWNAAQKYYKLCYDVYCSNGDKDILYLLAYTCKAIYITEKVQLNLDSNFDYESVIELCKREEEFCFHQHLISMMEIAEHDNETYKKWKSLFEITINPIP